MLTSATRISVGTIQLGSGAANHRPAVASTVTALKKASQGLRGPDASAMAPVIGASTAMIRAEAAMPQLHNASPSASLPTMPRAK